MVGPVSFTHLILEVDSLLSLVPYLLPEYTDTTVTFISNGEKPQVEGTPVSYTHLDVYKRQIKAYIQNQLKEDLEYDQMSLVEYIDPFTGEPVKKNKK